MTTVQALLAFIAAASLLTITPGLDTSIVLRSAAVDGRRSAAFASVGIGIGCLLWGAMVSIGLGAVLAASPAAFTAITYAGSAYLMWLGCSLILRPRDCLNHATNSLGLNPWLALKQGLLTNVLNPKVGIFYLTFLPQFTPRGASVALFSFLLAAVHVLLTLIWFTVLIAMIVPLSRFLRRPRAITAMDRISGGFFLMLGAKVGFSL